MKHLFQAEGSESTVWTHASDYWSSGIYDSESISPQMYYCLIFSLKLSPFINLLYQFFFFFKLITQPKKHLLLLVLIILCQLITKCVIFHHEPQLKTLHNKTAQQHQKKKKMEGKSALLVSSTARAKRAAGERSNGVSHSHSIWALNVRNCGLNLK